MTQSSNSESPRRSSQRPSWRKIFLSETLGPVAPIFVFLTANSTSTQTNVCLSPSSSMIPQICSRLSVFASLMPCYVSLIACSSCTAPTALPLRNATGRGSMAGNSKAGGATRCVCTCGLEAQQRYFSYFL